ncbi:MAG: class I SAM-dependent methyltransferase [Spirochaetes bacterium]|nr:class I SAM-dependent methyltransferase [Spirochaetota bacterium]
MFYRKLFRYGLSKIESGTLSVSESFADGENYQLRGAKAGEQAEMKILHPDFYRNAVLYGEIGFGEAYVAGYWDSPDLNRALRWFASNARFLPGFSTSPVTAWFMNILGFVNRIRHLLRPNTHRISRKNIAEHYDLGNPFYELMLGKTMAYSCGIYQRPDEALDIAQQRKFDLLCRKLQLKKSDHLLEIGSGWGGFAIYAAKKYGCRITTVTISEQQFNYAREKIRAAKLEKLIDIRIADYRTLEGKFDKIVSIEMAEAIGFRYFDTYFGKCAELLKEDGLLVLQYITYPESRFEEYLKNTDFTQIYIFPGSCLISNLEVMKSVHRTSDLMLTDVETIGQHYATTLRQWRQNVEKKRKEIIAMGYSETFLRKWVYYLAFCEAGFAARVINDVQVVFSRAHARVHGDFHGAREPYLDAL